MLILIAYGLVLPVFENDIISIILAVFFILLLSSTLYLRFILLVYVAEVHLFYCCVEFHCVRLSTLGGFWFGAFYEQWCYKHSCAYLWCLVCSFLQSISLGVELLGYRICTTLRLLDNAKIVFRSGLPVGTLTRRVCDLLLLHVFASIWYCQSFKMFVSVVDVWWHLIEVLICICLITHATELLFLCY